MRGHSPTEGRRRFLQALTVGAAGATGVVHSSTARAVASKAKIVIVGAGAAGTSMAARLRAQLKDAPITLLGRAAKHVYQPGLTLVAAGLWTPEQVVEPQSRWVPNGVAWVAEDVAEFDAERNAVVTDTGRRIDYDFLVVATGLELAFDLIEGFDPKMIGSEGIGCVYAGPEAAQGTYRMMERLVETGGDALMTLTHTPLKCAGAPLKLTFIVDDLLRRRGARGKAKVSFRSGVSTVFGVPPVNSRVLALWRERDIDVEYERRLLSVDASRRIARFSSPAGIVEERFDFLHVVPPMRAPAAVRRSPLAIASGGLATGGWLDVDKETLRHRKFENVFGCGDVNGTPRGKTAATVKKSGIVVAANLVDVIAGKTPQSRFDGYTSCPMVTSYGRAMLIEFDYEGRLTPTIPGVEPLTESWFAWFLEERMLKPAYFAMLKGWT